MQGVPHINYATMWYARLLWTLILILGTAGMALHLYYLINQFVQWPVQTEIKLGFDNLRFPAVTICNVNAIQNSKINLSSPALQSAYNQILKQTRTDYEHEVRSEYIHLKRFFRTFPFGISRLMEILFIPILRRAK